MSEKRHKIKKKCELPKYNSEKQSRLGPPCVCSFTKQFFSKPLIYGFWRNAHDQYDQYKNTQDNVWEVATPLPPHHPTPPEKNIPNSEYRNHDQ